MKQLQVESKEAALASNQVDVVFGLSDPATFKILSGNSTGKSCLEGFKMPDCLTCEPGYHSNDCHSCPNLIQNIVVTSSIALACLVLLILTLLYTKSLSHLYNHTVLIVCLGILHEFKGELYSV